MGLSGVITEGAKWIYEHDNYDSISEMWKANNSTEAVFGQSLSGAIFGGVQSLASSLVGKKNSNDVYSTYKEFDENDNLIYETFMNNNNNKTNKKELEDTMEIPIIKTK